MRASCVTALAILATVTGPALADVAGSGPVWRIELANDIVVGSDNQFTSGFTIQRHSPTAARLEDIRGAFAPGRWLARQVLPDRPGTTYRQAYTFGHNIGTPTDIEASEPILDDTPYLGMLGFADSWVAFDERRLVGFEVMLGLVGEQSFAEDIQNLVHGIVGSPEPRGWDNQLDTEPILNVFASWKRTAWSSGRFEGVVAVDGALGNFFTGGQVGLESRFGRPPRGFGYLPAPLGLPLHHDAALPGDGTLRIWGSVAARVVGYAFFMPRDGNAFVEDNPWTETNVIRPRELVGELVLGVHVAGPRWGVHAHFWITTDTVDPDRYAPVGATTNDFGTIMLERRF